MRGKPGTSIELTVVRDGEGNPLKITIERDVIKVVSVKSRTLEPGFGYLRISNFQARTTEDLLKAVAKLKAENKDGLQGRGARPAQQPRRRAQQPRSASATPS
jgi:carboxyl-terminal processing protease